MRRVGEDGGEHSNSNRGFYERQSAALSLANGREPQLDKRALPHTGTSNQSTRASSAQQQTRLIVADPCAPRAASCRLFTACRTAA